MHVPPLLIVAILVGLIFLVVVYGKGGALSPRGPLPFKPRPVMTDNERDFHATLKRALPDANWEAWPQVSMAAFIAPARDTATADAASRKAFWASFGKISNARVDWIVAYQGQARCVIELDDKTHVASKDSERDAIVRSVGLPTLRFQSKSKPDATELRASILAALA
jgi:hypothetical protein